MDIEMDWADDLYRMLAGEDEPLDRLIGMVDVDEEDELEICKRIRAYRSRPSDPLGSAVACQVGHKRDRSAISGSKRKSTPGTQGHDGFLGASRLFMCPIWARGGWS